MSAVALRSILGFFERWAPLELAEAWDNVGLLIEPTTGGETPVSGVMLTNDLTESVLDEAISTPKPGIQLILSYHPPLFKPINRITNDTWKGRIFGRCIKEGIAVYSPHTSWDNSTGGVSDWLLTPIVKDEWSREMVNKSGRKSTLERPIKLSEIVQGYKALTGNEHVRLALASNANLESECKTIAVCAGSGSSVLSGTEGAVDLWVTGEMSHHDLLNAQQCNTSVLLLEHSNSERGFLKDCLSLFKKEFPSVNFVISSVDKDPVLII